MAAPRADKYAGLRAVDCVEGDQIVVEEGNSEETLDARRGMCDVPPERITYNKGLVLLP